MSKSEEAMHGITFKDKIGYAMGDMGGLLTFGLVSAFLDAHKFVFGVFYDRHCTDSCSDGSDFVFGLSNLGRSKRPYVGFFYRLKEAH